jgi:hypothetical protein
MDIVKIFRVLVAVNFIAYMSFLFMDFDSFINSNTDLTGVMEESYSSVIDSWNVVAMVIFALVAIAMGPLLFFFVKWSRELLVGLLSIIFLVGMVDASNGSFAVVSELERLMTSLETITHGAILAIAYLTPVKDKFK